MRLVHAKTYTLHDFPPNKIPPYAILSHTWGPDTYEVTFADLQRPRETYAHRPGWSKIVLTCAQALRDSLEYAWIDTCCIDKSSSAELSEAINSMFAWYRGAAACYAYLVDVQENVGAMAKAQHHATLELALSESRWFTRGWTLQELLAPAEVMFYSGGWSLIGSRTDLARRIAAVTGIETGILRGTRPFQSACVARRMFWASHRETTRPEDLAYCLLGLFEIHMPTLYGEGDKAFLRLQEEILRTSDDHSLFAWVDAEARVGATSGLLAATPAMFQASGNVVSFRDWTEPSLPFSMSNSGLSISLPMEQEPTTPLSLDGPNLYRGFLNCAWSNDRNSRIFVQLQQIGNVTQQYCRTKLSYTLQSRERATQSRPTRPIFVRQSPAFPLPQDIVPSQPVYIELHRGSPDDTSVDYALRAYLHDESGIQQKNWFSTLMRQSAFNENDGSDPIFYIPGEPSRLTLVLLMEYLPTLSKFFIMLGSGYNSHLPMFDYRIARQSEHNLFNDIQHFLKSSRVVAGPDSYAARLDRNYTNKRMAKVRGWMDQFRHVYDPLLRSDSGSHSGTLLDVSASKSFCTMIWMSGVDHHMQITRLEGAEAKVGRIRIELRIGGHSWMAGGGKEGKDADGVNGKEQEWDACSQSVASIFNK